MASDLLLSTSRLLLRSVSFGDINESGAEAWTDLVELVREEVVLVCVQGRGEQLPRRGRRVLERRGVAVSLRASRGLDQNAACGQLRRQMRETSAS